MSRDVAMQLGAMLGSGLGAFIGALIHALRTRKLAAKDAEQDVVLRSLEERLTKVESTLERLR